MARGRTRFGRCVIRRAPRPVQKSRRQERRRRRGRKESIASSVLPGQSSPTSASACTKDETSRWIIPAGSQLTRNRAQGRREDAAVAGMCAGFRAGDGNGHHLINETTEAVCTSRWAIARRGDEGRAEACERAPRGTPTDTFLLLSETAAAPRPALTCPSGADVS